MRTNLIKDTKVKAVKYLIINILNKMEKITDLILKE